MTTDNVTRPNEDVVDILTTDHREMTELLARATQTQDVEQRRDLVETAIAEVMRHAVAEEMYVYPVMEKDLPGGKEEVEHDKQEHDEIVQVMKKLEEADAADPAFMELVQELDKQLRQWATRCKRPSSWRRLALTPAHRTPSCFIKVSGQASA